MTKSNQLKEPSALLPAVPSGPYTDTTLPVGGVPLRYYAGMVWHQRWGILALVALVTVATVLVCLRLPKEYDAAAVVRIDPTGVRTLGDDNSSQQNRPSADFLLATEQQLLFSPAVLWNTAEQLNLTQSSEFAAERKKANGNNDALRQAVLKKMAANMSVERPLDSLILIVHYRSHSPLLSSQVANALVESLIRQDFTTRETAFSDSSKYMQKQLQNLRAKMENSLRALVEYERQNQIVNPDDQTNIMNARLNELNTDLAQATAATAQAEANARSARTGGIDGLLASNRGAMLAPLYSRLLTDSLQLARLSEIYGPRHPLRKQQTELVHQDEAALQRQADHISRQLEAQYNVNAAREANLRNAVSVAQREVEDYDLKSIRFRALQAEATSYTKLYYNLQQQLQNAQVSANLHSEEVRLASPAIPKVRPVFPRTGLSAVLAFILSGILGVIGVLVLGNMDNTFKSAQQVEQLLRLRVLASIPIWTAAGAVASLPVSTSAKEESITPTVLPAWQESGPHSEAIAALYSTLRFLCPDAKQSLMITSTLPGEGKSTMVAALARTFALAGNRILLIDADTRRSRLHHIFGLSNSRGLTDVIGQPTLNPMSLVLPTSIPDLFVLPAGTRVDGVPLLLERHFPSILSALVEEFDIVLIDTPPVLGMADAGVIARCVDHAVLLIHAGKTPRSQVAAALRILEAVAPNLIGAILNRVTSHFDSEYSYYDSYKTYYGEEED